MSGVGLGAFAQGLAGGVSMAKSFKDGKKKGALGAGAVADQKPLGLGIIQAIAGGNGGSSETASATPADSSGDLWGILGGILGGLNNDTNTGG